MAATRLLMGSKVKFNHGSHATSLRLAFMGLSNVQRATFAFAKIPVSLSDYKSVVTI